MTDEIEYLPVEIRGKRVHVDERGYICLNDLYTASRCTKNKRPYDWQRLGVTQALKMEVLKRITGKSRNYTKNDLQSVSYTRHGAKCSKCGRLYEKGTACRNCSGDKTLRAVAVGKMKI